MARGLEPEVREFLYRHFESSTALEALLVIVQSGEPWAAPRLAETLDVGEDQAMDILVALAWQGFLTHEQAGNLYLYAPRDEELARRTAELVRLPASRLLAEIDAYTAPRSFADAFRLRPDKKPPRGSGGDR